MQPRVGNREPILSQYAPGCFVNAVGLTNPGAVKSAELLGQLSIPEDRFLLISIFGDRWNISLFHYRNHGAAYGRVLMGIQVPPGDATPFQDFLGKLTMSFVEETDNPTYTLFLR
jgi:hypothetical protein